MFDCAVTMLSECIKYILPVYIPTIFIMNLICSLLFDKK